MKNGSFAGLSMPGKKSRVVHVSLSTHYKFRAVTGDQAVVFGVELKAG